KETSKKNIELSLPVVEVKRDTVNYEQFFLRADSVRKSKLKAINDRKEAFKILVQQKAENSKFKSNFYKGRNYDENPLTSEESAELKKEADEVREMLLQIDKFIASDLGTVAVF